MKKKFHLQLIYFQITLNYFGIGFKLDEIEFKVLYINPWFESYFNCSLI